MTTDWQTVKLGDVAYEVSERVDNPSTSGYDRFVGLEHFVSGDFRITSWGITENLISAMKLFKSGDTLFARRNAYLKRASMADFDGICSGDAIVLRNNEKMIDGFLPLILNTEHFWNYAIANAAGSMSKRVRVEDLMKYEFPLPPVDEQRRIADLLWAADDVCEKYIELSKAVEKMSAAKSLDIFNRLMDEKVRFVKLSEICSRLPQSGLYKSKDFYGKGFPVVHMGELFGNDCIDENLEMQLIDLSEKEISSFQLTENDLLFGRRSIVLEGAGRCVYIGKMTKRMAFESSMIRVTINEEIAHNKFVFEWFRSPHGAQKIDNIRTFTTVAGVKGSDVAKLQVPLPSLDLQIEIVKQLSAVRNAIYPVENSLTAAKNLKKQLLASYIG